MLRKINPNAGFIEEGKNRAVLLMECGHVIVCELKPGSVIPEYLECQRCEECQNQGKAQK
mgnify:CR=1 FL=1